MIGLNKLRYHQDHPCRSVFLGCDWQACDRSTGIRYGLFVDILNGYVAPTIDQEKRIQSLVDYIEIEEAVEQFA